MKYRRNILAGFTILAVALASVSATLYPREVDE